GVDYSPTRAGGRVDGSPTGYNLFVDVETYTSDFRLLKLLGANTIRVYDGSRATTAFLDAAWAGGLRVVMGYPVSPSANLADSATRDSICAGFLTMVGAFKTHGAVLMWDLGNEVTLSNASAASNPSTWYAFLESCAAQAKAADPNHPI